MNRQYNCNTHKQILCRERGMFPMTKYELEKENERLQKAIKVQEIMLGNQDYAIKKARAEAIKEFAERLKEKYKMHFGKEWNAVYNPIDQIAKEMGVEL